ncbi:unnamed protein product [Allacma fusca]|uniref:Uncharacterized protein n=1 Tax=Allacma fusca TaxID=39272 RepID=A0A8J2LHM5_9HEXA|nr:unnamed protein product [Allacma fusca]
MATRTIQQSFPQLTQAIAACFPSPSSQHVRHLPNSPSTTGPHLSGQFESLISKLFWEKRNCLPQKYKTLNFRFEEFFVFLKHFERSGYCKRNPSGLEF